MLIVSPPPELVSSRHESGFEFNERIYPERGTVESFTESLGVCVILDPTNHREGALSKTFQRVQPSAMVAPPGVSTMLAWEGGGRTVSILISPKFIRSTFGRALGSSAFAGRGFARLREPDYSDEIIKNILVAIAIEVRNENPSGSIFLETLTMALASWVVLPSTVQTRIASRSKLSPRQLNVALSRIDANLGSKLSLTELAGALDVSTSFFCRAFRRSTGMSPHQFIIRRRIERARALIETGKMSLTEVALASGFSDHSQMAATFKKQLSVTPSFFAPENR